MSNNSLDDALMPRPDQATIDRQKMAADPLKSAWVSANAGSGKTYVLSTRVIRLLLDGVDPSKILCLTYTKTAAAEMKNRVFSRLGEWVTMEEADLAKALTQVTGRATREPELSFARTLFARALETPGGLKIQTIHAFCEALLHRFPLEANIAGHFELIDEKASGFLVAEARRKLLTGKNENTRGALARILARAGESGLEKLLNEIVNKRQKLDAIIDQLGDEAEREQTYLGAFGFEATETAASIEASIFEALPIDLEFMRSVRDESASLGKSRAYEFAYGCVVALENQKADDSFAQLRNILLKESGEAYSPTWLFAKDILNIFPTLADRYLQAAEAMSAVVGRINLRDEISKTLDALTIADRLLSLYATMKNKRGLLDFDDLIARTESMLLKDNVAAWVRFKLDQGIDHILVDEAQDTSPAQWRVIRILADEFFDGESAASNKRTVFAVGDEKQSIYSFQGADPRGFDDARLHFKVKVKNAQREFEDLRLDASFRSTGDVLAAVDHVFAYADHKRGLSGAEGAFPPHQSLRENQPGSVQLWEMEEAQETEDEEDWRKPVDHAKKPAVIVAERVATQIKNWIEENVCLEASGKPIQAGDVLVLVRKRDAFVNALSRALKERNVPVAGADRLSMVSHIAVMDLMALGRIMLNSSDDLSLAAVLRSPLFAWTDQQLFDLAYDREAKSLYDQLARQAANNEDAAHVFAQLEQFKTIALNRPIFEFYSHVLGVGGARKKLVGRLGPETGEMLDEFLNFAIAQERTGAVALETFLSTLENFSPEIKREMDGSRQQVKIMTVHGAKGLEAPIVFLVDPGSAAFTAQNAPSLLPVNWKDGPRQVDAILWGNSAKQRSAQAGNIIDDLKDSAEEEYRRLLYVGMTRAADQLIVVGYAGKRGAKDTWHSMVKKGLEEHSRDIEVFGHPAIHYPAIQKHAIQSPRPPSGDDVEQQKQVPACFSEKVPAEPPAARPLVPSGAYGFAIEPDRQDSDAEAPGSLVDVHRAEMTSTMSPQLALRRGTAIHTLLQLLPNLAPDQRREKAMTYCRQFESRWSQSDIEIICDQVFRVMDHPAYAPFFAKDARAEVSVMGTPKIGDEDRAVSGVIDRLSVTDDAVYLVDYKTNANPPRSVSEIPAVYIRQIALYHALVAPLYPDKPVKAALLFTATPSLIELDEATLASALSSMAPVPEGAQ